MPLSSHIKSGIEYAVITLLVAGLCLWQLISSTQDGEPPAGQLVLLGLGLTVSLSMHLVFMTQLVRRTGRAVLPWFVPILVFPIGTAVLLALLLSDSDAPQG
jgi:hypothetical protein